MKIQSFTITLIVSLLMLYSCKQAIKPEQLYGEWKYIKVESPNENPPLLMSEEDLRMDHPSIIFSGNDLVIMWGDKKLSYGKFQMEDQMIRYKENLGKGQIREFPFLVTEISSDRLVFETMSQNLTTVTAIKVK